ncbi:MAG: class I SAM-dependent methyltransferase [Candidatus Yanofskybacteria bacterium]|nr:class I SAM-dependent methyltransferase [Candidatus Yanofskybacteria bacterium]
MSQVVAVPTSPTGRPQGTGGFLDPDRIVDEFDIREGMQIADFGSGAGYFTILLGERVGPEGKVYALDVQEDKLDDVRVKAGVRDLKNIETIRADLEVLGSSGLSDNSQDVVLLANILFQSRKKSEILKEATRILKRDGMMVIIDWKKGTGGFGPPDDARTDDKEMIQLAQESDLVLKNPVDAGQFHYGLIFTKK